MALGTPDWSCEPGLTLAHRMGLRQLGRLTLTNVPCSSQQDRQSHVPRFVCFVNVSSLQQRPQTMPIADMLPSGLTQ